MTLRRWNAKLTGARSDAFTQETNQLVAGTLGMEPLHSTAATIEAYVRGVDGQGPPDRKLAMERNHLAILRMHGADVRRLVHASQLGLGFGVDLVHGDRWTERTTLKDDRAPRLTGVTPMASGIRYDATEPLYLHYVLDAKVHDLPESVKATLVGKRLSAVIGHGLPDDPVIRQVRDMTGHVMLVVDPGELVEIR